MEILEPQQCIALPHVAVASECRQWEDAVHIADLLNEVSTVEKAENVFCHHENLAVGHFHYLADLVVLQTFVDGQMLKFRLSIGGWRNQ